MPADAVAIVRAYPPLVVCFFAALTGTALVFDVFYLVASPGLALAAVYTVPVLAGLIAGLVAAADDVGLERRMLRWTIAATVAVGITNVVVVAMIAAMIRTGPSDWASGGRAVLFAAFSAVAFSVSLVVVGNLIGSLGIELRTHLPRRRKPVPAPVLAAPKPRASKEAAARAAVRAASVQDSPTLNPYADSSAADPYLDNSYADETFADGSTAAGRPAALKPPAPRIVDLDEPRPVAPTGEGTGHADRRAPRVRRVHPVPPSRRPHRPGRRPHN